MTTSQYQTLARTMRRVEEKVDLIEERLAFVWPTEEEGRVQLERELHQILSDGSIKVFADECKEVHT